MGVSRFNNPTSLGEIPTGWTIQPIEALCEKVTSGGTPLRSNPKFYLNGSIRWFKTKELNDGYLDDSEEKITPLALEKTSAKIFPPKTVLMAMYGDGSTITSLGILRKESATNQACCALIVNLEVCDYRFLFYSLKFHRDDFIRLATGGAQRNLSGTLIKNFAIKVPPLNEQKAIAHILGTLDAKIGLNQQMNRTLEGIARALFKSWFIDFDPVRTKLDGRQPAGMDAETAALFPDSFEDSPLGKIPKGWEFKAVEDLVEGVYDGPHATPKSSETGPVFLGIRNFTGTSLDLTNIRHINEEDWPRWTKRVTPRTNDIVFTYEATLGYFALIPDWLRCCLGRRTALIRPKFSENNAHFLFHCFTGSFFQEFLNSHINHGSTVDRILLKEFPFYPVLWPGNSLSSFFEDAVNKNWKLIHNNQKQNQE